MQFFLTSAALVASASLTFAAPAAHVRRSTFEVKQVAVGKVYKNGPLQMMKTFNKFAKAGAVAPAHVAAAAAAAQQSGTVAATPQQFDQAYLCPVTVGNNQLTMDFDTGSSDFWVFSTETPASESAGHSLYNPSTGTLETGESWSITYGDGSGASGNVYADKAVIGGVTATKQAIEAATSVSSTFTQNTASDGLVGFAFSSINTVKPNQVTTFFDTVSSTLAKKVFTADLKHAATGSYTLGYIDSSKYTGAITYVAVDNSQGFWGFTAGAGGSTNGSSASLGASIADTGTSLMYLPAATVKSYYAGVQGAQLDQTQGGYTFPCSTTPPAFNVNIGGGSFTVPGAYINYAPVDAAGTTCFGGIQENTGIGFNIFGDVFLKSVYAIFDQSTGSPRLGFANQ